MKRRPFNEVLFLTMNYKITNLIMKYKTMTQKYSVNFYNY